MNLNACTSCKKRGYRSYRSASSSASKSALSWRKKIWLANEAFTSPAQALLFISFWGQNCVLHCWQIHLHQGAQIQAKQCSPCIWFQPPGSFPSVSDQWRGWASSASSVRLSLEDKKKLLRPTSNPFVAPDPLRSAFGKLFVMKMKSSFNPCPQLGNFLPGTLSKW